VFPVCYSHLSRSWSMFTLFKLWLNPSPSPSAKRWCASFVYIRHQTFSRERREVPYTSILCNYSTNIRCGRRSLEETLLSGQKEESGSEQVWMQIHVAGSSYKQNHSTLCSKQQGNPLTQCITDSKISKFSLLSLNAYTSWRLKTATTAWWKSVEGTH
jgi:hypothetical protein